MKSTCLSRKLFIHSLLFNHFQGNRRRRGQTQIEPFNTSSHMFVVGIKPVIFFLLTGRQGVQPWFPATWVLSNGCVYDSRSHCCSTLLLFPAHSVDGYKKLTFIFLFSLYFFFSSRFLTPWEEIKSIRALWNVVPAAVVNCDSEKQLSGKGWIKKWWMEFKGTQTHASQVVCLCVELIGSLMCSGFEVTQC